MPATTDRPAPIVVLRGVLGQDVTDYAEAAISGAIGGRARLVRVILTRSSDPTAAEPLHAAARVEIDGAVMDARADADTPRAAVDRLADRLERRLATRARREQAHRVRTLSVGPAPGRSVLSHPTYSGPRCTVDDAVADMNMLGYDFHLFTDVSGEDCLLIRTPDGHVLSGAHGRPPWREGDLSLLVRDQGAPWMTAEQAMARLDLSGARLLFYVDHADRRGRLLYHRDEGYGLITPAVAGARR